MYLKKGSLLQGGRYVIESVIGEGGFGITYLAYQNGLNRKVAIKEFFMDDYCYREDDTYNVSVPSVGSKDKVDRFRAKFVKEARIIAELKNVHVITIYDIFDENGTSYYVMEYIDGGSLATIAKKGEAMSLDVALSYIRQVADALKYCHSKKIAHLDVKPGNILVNNGIAVLIDFGIAKHYNESGEQTSSTPIGISKGYAPIEQYKRGGVTNFSPVTDIYSLGAVLFRLLTGQTPPDADEVNEEGLPEFPSDIPQYIQDAITAAMHPKKKDRPQNIEEFLTLLVEPVAEGVEEDDSEDTELEGKESEDTELTDDAAPSEVKIVVPHNRKLLYGIAGGSLAGVAVVLCILLGVSSSEKRELAESDQTQYLSLITSADSLSRNESSLPEAMALYDSAAVFETQYTGTRFSDLFDQNALSSSSRVQSQIDSIAKVRQQETEEKLRQELAAAEQARLEREQAEKEGREGERKDSDIRILETDEQVNYQRAQKESERTRNEVSSQNIIKNNYVVYKDNVLYVNEIEYPMVHVKGGTFLMGSTEYRDEKPVHSATVSDYYIGKYEVTQDLWEAIMINNPSKSKGSRRPVEWVTWDQCQEFISKLNDLTGKNFRLPTEQQWEFAARGGTKSRGYRYSGSDIAKNVAWFGDTEGETHDVATKAPNELGIYDMSGNVSEWCLDRYSKNYNYRNISDNNRVIRGGNYLCNINQCRVAFRGSYPHYMGVFFIGFRLCL